jgi:hypothetical protein
MRVAWIERWSWLAAVLLVASCASTTLTGAWKNPAYQGGAFHKLLVVGATDSPTDRRIFEDAFAQALRAAGVDAVASYTVIAQEGKIDERRLKDAVRSQGLQGVVMTRLVRIDKQTVVTPGYASTLPSVRYRDNLYGYYATTWAPYGMPPEVREVESVVLETTLWNAADSKLVWTGTTSTFAPSNVQSATADFAQVVISELKARNLL